ncbi:hypothetical protein LZ30DRAFT_16183 [Colletotrichum cereale]|nr:hypothetical protein LZ30DRAFT_16183 [Colletotrichum cereale]
MTNAPASMPAATLSRLELCLVWAVVVCLLVRVRLPSQPPVVRYSGHRYKRQARGVSPIQPSQPRPGGVAAQAKMPRPSGVYCLFEPSHLAGLSLTTRDETFFFSFFLSLLLLLLLLFACVCVCVCPI